jgi:hypothetical protein
MTTPMKSDMKSASVNVSDELTVAIQSAQVRIAEVYADGCHTFIDSLTLAQWMSWDGSKDLAIVCDRDGLNVYDDMGDEEVSEAA